MPRFAVIPPAFALLALGGALRAQSPLRDLDISLDILTSAGTSTARDAALLDLKGGAHDSRRRGFTLQQAELTIAGTIRPELSGMASLIATIDPEGETVVELEEAMLDWRGAACGFALEAGVFFTDIGRLNALHPHERTWLDQPVVHTRLLGGDGLRGPGLRLRWRSPEPSRWDLSLGAQSATGETMVSFLASEEIYDERGIGGRFFTERDVRAANDVAWSARVARTFDLGEGATGVLGVSAAAGPNATGGNADTLLYGADIAVSWRHEHEGHHHDRFRFEGEFLARAFDNAAQSDDRVPSAPVTLPATTLDDYGGFVQGLLEVSKDCYLGLRAEWASGRGASYDQGTQTFGRSFDPYRDDRLRVSPLVTWAPSETTRVRLQYDYDDADWLGGDEHSIWLGFEIQLGAHAAH